MRSFSRIVLGLASLTLPLLSGCSLHSTATHWNGHVGPDGKPVFVLNSSYFGFHLGIMLPFIGSTKIDNMIDESTKWIMSHEGSNMRLVETETNNYWYTIPPVSWFLSPVMTNITFEYQPSATALAAAGVELPQPAMAEPQR